MSDFRAAYLDKDGNEIGVHQGIGGPDGDWGVYRRKPNGSLARLRSPLVGPQRERWIMEDKLRRYAKKKGWKAASAYLPF